MAPNIRRVLAVVAVVVSCLLPGPASRAATSPAVGSWLWPIEGRVVRAFEPPATPFSAGHRGIDIAAAFGTPVHAAADGVVSFSGFVAGELFLTVDHGDGYRSTDSWLGQVLVKTGTAVQRGDLVALSGRGDPKVAVENLMFGVRLGDDYIDPLTVLAPQSAVDLIRLAAIPASSGNAMAWTTGRRIAWRGDASGWIPRSWRTRGRGSQRSVGTVADLRGPRWVS